MKRILWLVLLFFLTAPIFAQEAFTEYYWENGNLTLNYPVSWDEPLQRFSSEGDRVMLMLAQTQVDSPETRPPAIPFVTITLLRNVTAEDDLYQILEEELASIGITGIGALPAALFDEEAIATFGTSRDGLLYGTGRIISPGSEHDAIMISGRAATVQRDEFVSLFNTIVNSITLSAGQSAVAPEYGVLWQTSRTLVDGEQAFLDIGGLALAGDGTLYFADAVVGLVALDSSTGVVKSISPFAAEAEPVDIAIGPDGAVHVADTLCACIHIFNDGIETSTIDGFAQDAPASIAIAADNTLYITDNIADEYLITVLGSDFGGTLSFDEFPVDPPLLAIDRLGRLIALVDGQFVYALEDDALVFQYELSSIVAATAITIDLQNNLLVATEDAGILIFDGAGNEINQVGRVVATEPQAGELLHPHGVAAGLNGAIYWTDSDGTFGNVTAMSLSVESGRIGASNLTSGVEAQGFLEGSIKHQYWTFDATVGDVVTITALADESAFDLDIAVHLLDPEGSEIAFVDNDETGSLANFSDAQISDFRLQRDGQYIIIVESVSGEGRYRLGLSKNQSFELAEPSVQINGTLSDTIPVQRWRFEAQFGQTLTITLNTIDGTLDPVLRLLNPQGSVFAENDDAEDISLGFDSQLLDIRLPSSGVYTIEAVRFDGQGSYRLTIESN